jgi:hypothetical protein
MDEITASGHANVPSSGSVSHSRIFTRRGHVSSWMNSGLDVLALSLSAYDP